MAKNFPCPRCCKHVVITDDIFANGGIVACKNCGYQIKFTASSRSQDSTTDTKEDEGKSDTDDPGGELSLLGHHDFTPEEREAMAKGLVKEPPSIITAYKKYQELNPKPYVRFGSDSHRLPTVEVGLKVSF